MSDYQWGSHTHSLNYVTTPTWTIETKEPEEVTTLEKIRRERRERVERDRIEQQYELLDNLELYAVPEGAVLRFDVEDGTDVKTYAVLYAGGKWWATGGTSPNGSTLEDLLSWMIRKNVNPAKVVIL